MDLSKAIQELYIEKARLEESIALLEELQSPASSDQVRPAKGRRGRKMMDSEERKQVSSRMRAYWASRRSKATTA